MTVHGDDCRRWAAGILFALALTGTVRADDVEQWKKLAADYRGSMRAGRYAQAEPIAKEMLAIAEKSGDLSRIADSLCNLAAVYRSQARPAEAGELYKRALAILVKTLGPNHPLFATALNDLAVIYSLQGRYVEAEPLLKRTLAIRQKVLPKWHPDIAQSYHNLGTLYEKQRRLGDAANLYKIALTIREKSLGPDHPAVAGTLRNMAALAEARGQPDEAEILAKRAVAIYEKTFGIEHPETTQSLNTLAVIYGRQKRYAESEAILRQILAIRRQFLGPEHTLTGQALINLAICQREQERPAEALALADLAVTIFDRGQANSIERFRGHYQRACIRWSLGQQDSALADMKTAIGLAEQQRALGSGGERERAHMFAGFAIAFERMIEWQAELGNVGKALEAMERSRARSLLDQIETHDVDLLAGVPDKLAAALQQRKTAIQTEAADIDKQLQLLNERKDLSPEDRKQQAESLERRLRKAQADFAVIYADICNASPAYRLAVGRDHQPVALEKLSKWVVDQQALLLEYSLGSEKSYVLALRPNAEPRLAALAVNETQAQVLGVAPGPLDTKRLGAMLANAEQTGVMQILKEAANPSRLDQVVQRLAVLWEVFIPEAERQAIEHGGLKRIVVIPDGLQSSLPFETLVVRSGQNPRYLLDMGLPVQYAPSATILMNLCELRPAPNGNSSSVLSVGNPRYGPQTTAEPADAFAKSEPSARWAVAGGHLQDLPFTEVEVSLVTKAFAETEIKVTELLRDRATEKNVRIESPGQRILHLACHGLVDLSHGNLFGALALTPGPDAADPNDDGYLTLAEVYAMQLSGTELAILSACETNYGPHQWGEGVYGLSRGFLVAGARRVIASNWLVEDEATANLITRLCAELAAAWRDQQPADYAEALHKAKLSVRRREGWESPFYWGPFVLIGPN